MRNFDERTRKMTTFHNKITHTEISNLINIIDKITSRRVPKIEIKDIRYK